MTKDSEPNGSKHFPNLESVMENNIRSNHLKPDAHIYCTLFKIPVVTSKTTTRLHDNDQLVNAV
jgi:hypothetical protein